MIPLGLKDTKELDWSAALTVSACRPASPGPGACPCPGACRVLGASWPSHLIEQMGKLRP